MRSKLNDVIRLEKTASTWSESSPIHVRLHTKLPPSLHACVLEFVEAAMAQPGEGSCSIQMWGRVLALTYFLFHFWATFCKTVRLMLSDRCPVCLSVCLSVCHVCPVCNVGVLLSNGWTDQDEIWQVGRPWPLPQCIGWGPGPPLPMGHSPQFSAMSTATKRLHGSRHHSIWR